MARLSNVVCELILVVGCWVLYETSTGTLRERLWHIPALSIGSAALAGAAWYWTGNQKVARVHSALTRMAEASVACTAVACVVSTRSYCALATLAVLRWHFLALLILAVGFATQFNRNVRRKEMELYVVVALVPALAIAAHDAFYGCLASQNVLGGLLAFAVGDKLKTKIARKVGLDGVDVFHLAAALATYFFSRVASSPAC